MFEIAIDLAILLTIVTFTLYTQYSSFTSSCDSTMRFHAALAGSVLSIVGTILLLWSSNLIQEYLSFIGQHGRELNQELRLYQILAAVFIIVGNAALMYGTLTTSTSPDRAFNHKIKPPQHTT